MRGRTLLSPRNLGHSSYTENLTPWKNLILKYQWRNEKLLRNRCNFEHLIEVIFEKFFLVIVLLVRPSNLTNIKCVGWVFFILYLKALSLEK